MSMLIKILFCLFIAVGQAIADDSEVRNSQVMYNNAWNNNDPDQVYAFFTPYSKKMVDYPAFEKTVIEFDSSKQKDSIHKIRIKDDGKTALVVVRSVVHNMFGKEVSSTYTTTWKLIDGKWYRAYIEDKEKESPTSDVESISFKLEEFVYSWGIYKSLLGNNIIYRPEIRFRVKNTGTSPIDYLKFKVHFIEKSKNKIFSTVDEYAIGSSDIPLKEGVSSETYFLKSFIGFNIETLVSDMEALSIVFKDKTDGVIPIVYYKTGFSSNWIEHNLE